MTNENLYTDDKQRQAQELKNQARADAQQLAEQAKATAQEVRGKVETEARAKAEVGRDQAASEIETLAHAARAAADDLRENQHDALSQYVGGMAQTVADLADGLRHKSVDELVRDVESLARRNPALFLAGSVAIGLGIARFAKASSDRHASSSNYGLESDQSYSGNYAGAYDNDAGYSGARGYTDGTQRQASLQPGYDSQFESNRGFGASSRDDSFDDSLATSGTAVLGSDADSPERLIENDLGGSDSAGEAYIVKERETFLVKERDDKASDSPTNV
jgi:hypothetical protein